MFFNGWEGLGRTLIMGLAAYATLIVLLRISGKRTLAKLNAFDLIVTVALGSTLATVILSKDIALAEGALAMALLIVCQFAVSWLSVRSDLVRKSVRSEPTILFYRGEFLRKAMLNQRVTEAEIRQATRSQGVTKMDDQAVVLETDGSFSVLSLSEEADSGSLADIRVPRSDRSAN